MVSRCSVYSIEFRGCVCCVAVPVGSLVAGLSQLPLLVHITASPRSAGTTLGTGHEQASNGWDKVVHLRRGERRWGQLRTDQFRAGPSRLVEGAREAGPQTVKVPPSFHLGADFPILSCAPREENLTTQLPRTTLGTRREALLVIRFLFCINLQRRPRASLVPHRTCGLCSRYMS